MKKKILKDADGNDIAVTELESFSNVEDLMADPEDFVRRAEREEEDDRRLDDLCSKIMPLYEIAKTTGRTVNYWQIGATINVFEGTLPRRDRRERWLMKSNILQRLAQKIDRKGLSRRHLEEMIYFQENWSLDEIDARIPWSFYAELAIKANRLPRNKIRALERLIISGQITDHKK